MTLCFAYAKVEIHSLAKQYNFWQRFNFRESTSSSPLETIYRLLARIYSGWKNEKSFFYLPGQFEHLNATTRQAPAPAAPAASDGGEGGGGASEGGDSGGDTGGDAGGN